MKVIRTTEGYMVEQEGGDYLCDEHGDNTWETRLEAEAVATEVLGDSGKHLTLLDAQMSAFSDSIALTDYQMYTALQFEVPDWIANHKYEDWRYYEARYELGYWSDNFYRTWKEQQIEETRARWARNALLYKWQTPDGFFYACSKKEDGTYRYVGFRYGLHVSEYASGFDGMGYTPREVK
jgi:hypothetical protein